MINLKKMFGGLFWSVPSQGLEDDELLKLSSSIFENKSFTVRYGKVEYPRFQATHDGNIIYLPKEYSMTDPFYNLVRSRLGEDFLPRFAAYHELGHAAQVARLDNGRTVHIKNSPRINYLFNGVYQETNAVREFMQTMYKEGFADCYAGLCLYKESLNHGEGNLEVFQKIYEIRALSKAQFQSKVENKDGLNSYFNLLAPLALKDTISRMVESGKDIFSIPFFTEKYGSQSIEKYIDRAVLYGTFEALKRELLINDPLLNSFRDFVDEMRMDRDFSFSDCGYFIGKAMKEHGKNVSDADVEAVIAYERSDGIALFFSEVFKRLEGADKKVFHLGRFHKVLMEPEYKRQTKTDLRIVVQKPINDTGLNLTKDIVKSKLLGMREQDNESKITFKA